MKKKLLEALNQKAREIERLAEGEQASAEALGGPPPMPQGCTTIFDTGWETNQRPTSPVGNCAASARDFHGCAGDCWWPARSPTASPTTPTSTRPARTWRGTGGT